MLEPPLVGFRAPKTRIATIQQRGKRKDVYLDLKADDILLDG